MWCRFPASVISRLAVASLAASAIWLASTTPVVAGFDKSRSRAERALRAGDYTEAENIYREILSRNAHDLEARLGLSQALLKQRNIQDAYDHAARVLIADPLSAKAHALLGSAILAAGGFRESVEEFRTALSLNEDEDMAIAGLAMIDFYENRSAAAIRGLQRAASLSPNEPDYVFNLGQAAARTERYKEAADAYERFLVIAPKTDADRRARIRGLIDFLRYLGQQKSLYTLSGSSRTSIPFEALDNRPVLLVRVNNEKTPFRFVLDTGSGMSVISETTAKRLGLRAVAQGGMARASLEAVDVLDAAGFEVIVIETVGVGQAEVEIAHSFHEAAKSYQENPTALHLRAMNMLYEGLKEKEAMLEGIVKQVMKDYPRSTYRIEIKPQYRNMKQVIDHHPETVDYAMEAIRRAGLTPVRSSIRGGTDGSRLSFMGLPCPNIFAGEHAFHSRLEWVSRQDMEKAAETIVHLAMIWEERS